MNVVLVGDSIRMGYQKHVEEELSGFAEVWGSEENGGSSQRVLENLDSVIERSPDVVHVNAGLHDLRRPFGSTANQVTLEEYYRNIRTITGRLRDETRARLIWATTTPLDEEWHNRVHGEEEGDFRRFAVDVNTYNEGLLDQAHILKLEINDLHAVVVNAGPDRILHHDGVHFTDEGDAMLGKAVAGFIRG